MKADKQHRITIPGIYLKRLSIGSEGNVILEKGKGYGQFYIIALSSKTSAVWKKATKVQYRSKLILPKELYSKSAEYTFGMDKGGVFFIKNAA